VTRQRFWDLINSLCDEFDGSVTSGKRSLHRNHAVGGAKNSRHLNGFAADVVLDDWGKKERFTNTAQELGLRVIDEIAKRHHLHVDVDPSENN
jgi:uncharacterized protein YcbK (DUF882 family)